MIRETKTTARRANLPEHGGQRDDHPVLLFTILLTLHTPPGHQHSGVLVKYFCQFTYFRRRYTTNLRSPLCRFGDIIGFPHKIVGKSFITGGTAGKKRLVVPAVFHQRMGNAEHQGDIGTHMRGDPLHFVTKEIHALRSHRINADQAFTAVA
ncbi:hypothetical protein D3C73_1106870 [compost metagenome]